MKLANLDLDSLNPVHSPSGPLPGKFPLGKSKYNFAFPVSIELTPEGHLLVASQGELSGGVHEYDPTTDELVLAFGPPGSADQQLNAPISATLHNNLIYVLDADSYKVFDRNGTFLSKVGTSGFANGQFNSPMDIAIDKNGLIYIADCGNDRVQVFNSNGTHNRNIGLGFGSGNGQMNCPYGIDVDDDLNVYVVEYDNDRVQKFDSSGNFVMKFGVSGIGVGQFQQAARVRVDSLGNIWVAEISRQELIKFSSAGTYIATYKGDAGGHDPIGVPFDFFFGPDDSIYIADGNNKRIEVWDKNGVNQKTYRNYTSAEGALSLPTGLWIDSADNFFVAQSGAGTSPQGSYKFDSRGNYLVTYGSKGTGVGQLEYGFDSATDSEGHIYITDNLANNIEKFASDGTHLLTIGSAGTNPGQFNGPSGIYIDKNDIIYVADLGNSRVQKLSKDGTYLGEIGNSGGAGQLDQPSTVHLDKDGNIYVCTIGASRKIYKYDASGNFLFSFGDGPYRFGIYVDSVGNIYSTNYDQNRVDKFDSGGNFLVSFGSLGSFLGELQAPADIAGDSYGNLYVVDVYNHRVQKFSPLGIPLEE
ncbi:6-bladed beta-propeller [Bdellovibrio bacteriovorus]|uniref:6-bladed beta-propeller n=1 Tax=Bdellovibrio bacteriovorus TaxID=959 RepID=UPI0035A663D7